MRRGFTLTELLVVITVIAVLGSLLIPAVGMVKKLANDTKCQKQLGQLAIGLIAYQEDDPNNRYPGRLSDLMNGQKGAVLGRGLEKLLLCPQDANRGTKAGFGRDPTSVFFNEQYPELYDPQMSPAGPPISYLFEGSGEINPRQGTWEFFHQFVPGGNGALQPAAQIPPLGTWFEGKKYQLGFGNGGDKFSSSRMPLVRCYWHHIWTSPNLKTDAKVINVTWDGNVWKSIPFWEVPEAPQFYKF